MRRLSIIILSILLISKLSNAQHFVPVDLVTEAKDINVSIYGGFSFDGANGAGFADNLSSTTQSGFIVNALHRINSGRNGTRASFHQFLIDINPIIVDWNPFTWNKLVKQPIESFNVYKMPFQEDAVLHIGWHKNTLSKYYRGGKDQLQQVLFFGEMYFTPYNVTDSANTYKFSLFNVNIGSQYAYIKKNVPVLGNFLVGASLQMNFMLTNETNNYLGSMQKLMQSSFHGKQYMGPGAKIVVQTNNLNIYVEGRQYYSLDNGQKFTKDPIILVGAFGSIKWKKYKNKVSDPDDDILE